MGIVDELLAEFDLATLGHCRIEADVNDSVHLHLGSVRVELSEREFRELVSTVEDAQARLRAVKALDGPPEPDRPAPGPEDPVDAV